MSSTKVTRRGVSPRLPKNKGSVSNWAKPKGPRSKPKNWHKNPKIIRRPTPKVASVPDAIFRSSGDSISDPGGAIPSNCRKIHKSEDCDVRKVLHIEANCCKDIAALLKAAIPHRKLLFVRTKIAEEHVVANTVRSVAESMAIASLRKMRAFDKHNPLLDVGSSFRKRNADIHSCECGLTIAGQSKLEDMRARYPSSYLRREDGIPAVRRGWTFCGCSAKDCGHCVPGAALFVHSVYYNTPDEVAQIVHNTLSKKAISIHHRFPNLEGWYYEYKGTAEMHYVKSKPHSDVKGVPVSLVSCFAKGNEGSYQHNDLRWLDLNGGSIPVTITANGFPVLATLTWKNFPVDGTGQTKAVVFRLLDTVSVISDTYVPKFKSDSELKILRKMIKVKLGRHARAWQAKRTINIVSDETFVIPKAFVASGVKFFMGKPIDTKTTMSLVMHLRRGVKDSLYQQDVDEYNLSRSIPIVAEYVKHICIEEFKKIRPLKTFRTFFEERRHNSLVLGHALSDKIRTLIAIGVLFLLLRTLGIIASGSLHALVDGVIMLFFLIFNIGRVLNIVSTLLVLLFIFAIAYAEQLRYYDGRWVKQTDHWSLGDFSWQPCVVGSVEEYSLLFYVLVVSAISVIYLRTTNNVLKVLTALFISPALAFMVLVKCIIERWSSCTGYETWDLYKQSVVMLRRCPQFPGCYPIRPGDGFPVMRTWTNPNAYPPDPKAKLRIKEDLSHVRRKNQATTAVGICFDSAAPIVHSNEQYNLIVAIKTRVITLTKIGKKWAWELLDRLMRNECPMVNRDGFPTPVDYMFKEVNGEIFTMKDAVTWKDYVSRFPPVKRERLEKCREKVKAGDFHDRHLNYTAFVKKEKIMGITAEQFTPLRPRVIQAVSWFVKVLCGYWFLMYSYALKAVWHPRNWIWYCSGHTTTMFNFWIESAINKCGGLDNCGFIVTDFSTYDITQGEFCIRREHAWYRKLGFVKWIYQGSKVIMSKSKTTVYADGLKATYWWKRKSGDNDTSSGNSKNTGDIIGSFYKMVGLKPAVSIAVLGDDNFTVVDLIAARKIYTHMYLGRSKARPSQASPFFAKWPCVSPRTIDDRNLLNWLSTGLKAWCEELGMKLKVITTLNILEAEFLSCRFYPTSSGSYRIGKKPGRVLEKIGYFLHRQGRSHLDWLALLKGTIISYRPTGSHVPFLRVYLDALFEMCNRETDKIMFPENVEYRLTGPVLSGVDSETWDAFYRLYGYDEKDEQRFVHELWDAYDRHGLPVMVHSEMVENLSLVDRAL